ncbi:MAG: hypothetical protein JNJ73_07105 [Hyphomonadaceae bacterium]|nr:hypothetical protein [Hyphomonadaceae bacterium]
MDSASARAFAESVLGPGEPLLWWQMAPVGGSVHDATGAMAITIGALLMAWQAVRALRDRDRRSALVMGVACACASAFGVHCWGYYLGGESRVYVITEGRLVIASRDPWTIAESYGPEAFSCWRRDGDRIEFALSSRRTRHGAWMAGLREPERVQALIRERVAARGANAT